MSHKSTQPLVPPWIAPTFTDTWVNYGGVYETVAYMRTPDQIVHLRGLMKDGTIGNSAFTLPAGYRPANSEAFATTTSGPAFGSVEVAADGTVKPTAGSNVSFSLSGITFRAAP